MTVGEPEFSIDSDPVQPSSRLQLSYDEVMALGSPNVVGGSVRDVPGQLVSFSRLVGRELVVPLSTVIRYPHQPRRFFPDKEVHDLAGQLSSEGQLMPMVVGTQQFPDGTSRFILSDGEMRLRALPIARIDQALVVVHEYLDEDALFKAAAATHKDSTTLGAVDRMLMYGDLYEIERRSRPGLKVTEFARELQVGVQQIHYGRRMARLPDRLLELAVNRIIPTAGITYLMNRMREARKRDFDFPAADVVHFVDLALTRKRERREREYFPEREIREIYERALIRAGRGNEAMQKEIDRELAVAVSAFRRAHTLAGVAFDLVEEEGSDPTMVEWLAATTPRGFGELEAMFSGLEVQMEHFASLMAHARALRESRED